MIRTLPPLATVIILQVITKHFLSDIELDSEYKNMITYVSLGLGLFFVQDVYYERKYLHWGVPLKEKLNLKHTYLFTLLGFAAIYICLLVMKN